MNQLTLAALDLTAFETALGADAATIVTAVGAAAILGLGIGVVRFGARYVWRTVKSLAS